MEYFTIENIGKVVALLVSVAAAYKAFSELFSKKKEKLRADYEFAEKFVADDKWKTMHDYLLERGYWGLAGKQLEASIIRYFLKERDPLGKITDYTQGLRFLEASRDSEQNISKITYIKKLDSDGKRVWKNFKLIAGYLAFAFLSLGPVIFLDKFIAGDFSVLVTLIAWVTSFGLLAYVNLEELWAFQSAKRIVEFEANKVSQQDAESASA